MGRLVGGEEEEGRPGVLSRLTVEEVAVFLVLSERLSSFRMNWFTTEGGRGGGRRGEERGRGGGGRGGKERGRGRE